MATDPICGMTVDEKTARSAVRDGVTFFFCSEGCLRKFTGYALLSISPSAVLTDFNCPNGLCFSPDETRLYVADTGRVGHPDPQHIRAFDMTSGQPQGGEVFHVISPGCADGMRVDTEGNLWSSARDGVHCIAPDGTLLGKILVPEIVSNLCFGGRAKQQMFITATTSLYAISLNRSGAQQP